MRRCQRYLFLALLAVSPLAANIEAAQPKPPVTVPAPAPARVPVYGFPTSSYRYGWFGANYWPRMSDHRGYYGDHFHFKYRCGY
jgi:hypothetical protein